MQNVSKLYLNALLDVMLIMIATLSNLDLQIRIGAGIVGILLGLLTCVKFIQDIRLKYIETKRKKVELDILIRNDWEKAHK